VTRAQLSRSIGNSAAILGVLAALSGCSNAAKVERPDAAINAEPNDGIDSGATVVPTNPPPVGDAEAGVDPPPAKADAGNDTNPAPSPAAQDDAGPLLLDASSGTDASSSEEPRDAGSPTLDAGNDASVSGLGSLRFTPYPAVTFPAENPHAEAKALLGKVLFWEEQLSADNSVACGTCHRGAAGGSDPRSADAAAALPGPDGVFDTTDDIHGSPGLIACDATGMRTGSTVQVTGRKAPSYLDAMFARRLFWDGRAECSHEDCPNVDAFEDPDNPGTFPIAIFGALENQAVGPPLSSVEMACEGTTWPDLHEKLEGATPLEFASEIPADLADFIAEYGGSYPALFQAAFGSEQTSGAETEINTRRIAFAIATHERRLTSDQTPWDYFNAGDDDALTEAQVRGLRVFRERAQCSSCHLPPLFSDGAFHYTGFHRPSSDPGRGAINGRPTDNAEMRTPTLRNVGLRISGGLLHNGAGLGASLESVIETYVQGGLRDDPEVSAVPITESIQPLDLSEQEVADLIDFLVNGLTDPRVAAELQPFDRPRLGSE
jgi:cytochrome c peroxidase